MRRAIVDIAIAVLLAAIVVTGIGLSNGTRPHGPTGGEGCKCTCGLAAQYCTCCYATSDG